MKIGQKEIDKIHEIALSTFRDQSPNISWIKNRGEISDSERRTIAFVKATSRVLGLEIEIEHYKPVSLGCWEEQK